MMIDPLDLVINYLIADSTLSTLIGVNIAESHEYGTNWAPGSGGVSVTIDGGQPEIYLPIQKLRLEVLCYGSTYEDAFKIYRAIHDVSRTTERVVVHGADGYGLIYYILPQSGPTKMLDPDLGDMDIIIGFFECLISEETLTIEEEIPN